VSQICLLLKLQLSQGFCSTNRPLAAGVDVVVVVVVVAVDIAVVNFVICDGFGGIFHCRSVGYKNFNFKTSLFILL
jgi:hypothetical protein